MHTLTKIKLRASRQHFGEVEESKRGAYDDPGGEGVGAAVGEGVEGDLGGGVLGLAKSGAVVGALEGLAVEVNDGLEARRVVWTFPYADVGGQVEAAPLRQLLQLVLIHFLLLRASGTGNG
nr:hypothetical protein B296_00002089 [Ipomoea batatas]